MVRHGHAMARAVACPSNVQDSALTLTLTTPLPLPLGKTTPPLRPRRAFSLPEANVRTI